MTTKLIDFHLQPIHTGFYWICANRDRMCFVQESADGNYICEEYIKPERTFKISQDFADLLLPLNHEKILEDYQERILWIKEHKGKLEQRAEEGER